jgi:hypothetical protein
MTSRIAVLLVALGSVGVAGQAKWTPMRTPDGQPDIQGIWVAFDSTPFEAPGAPTVVGGNPNVNPPAHWTDHDSPMAPRRASMVVDPPRWPRATATGIVQ